MKRVKKQTPTRKLATVCVALGWFCSSPLSLALGLGNLTPSSYLGQPLEASIAIATGNEDYQPEELKVRQLTGKQAAALGIDLAGSEDRYRLILSNQSGQLEVLLSSRQPVDEPFLNLLVELKWPTGTVYREYTVLLDPPGFTSVVTAPKPASKPTATTRRPVASQPATKLSSGSGRYAVQSGDSLSKIADRLITDSNTSRRDMMRWLLANNPRAFQNGDMNRLLAGAKLTLPAEAELASLPPAANTSPAAATRTQARPAAAMPAEQAAPAAPAPQRGQGKQLTIVTPNLNRGGVSAEELSQAETILALRDTVVATQELAERMKRDNEAMHKRLQAIERSGYITSLERLVELKEEEILALKTQLSSGRLAASKAAGQGGQADARTGKQLAPVTANNAAADKSAADTNTTGMEQRWWMLVLLFIALLGAGFFFYRWRIKQPANKQDKAKALSDEQALLAELEAMATPSPQSLAVKQQLKLQAKYQNRQAPQQVLDATRQGFKDLGKKARDAGRRSDEQIQQSIREKTNHYIPDILAGKHESDYDELDRLIAEALGAANRGSFGVAESLLLAERSEQVRKPAKRENEGDARLEAAIVYVEQLRQIKYAQHFEN
jgi:FimV-like protein